MLPNGLSLIVHLLILFLVFLKRTIDLAIQKLGWYILRFKISFWFRKKLIVFLIGQPGNILSRKILSYAIVLFVFSAISSLMIISMWPRLSTDSNIELVGSVLKNNFAVADERAAEVFIKDDFDVEYINVLPSSDDISYPEQDVFVALLPVSEDIKEPINNN
ncbi:MAG: hypothetical protein HY764_03500 [Candidatus Portnoybacteria bacterium]|nr:hypothetical protein [Candidatus Portnoybacteria bacterium]